MTIYTKSVTSNVSNIFSLKKSDFHILNHYGKHGPVFRNNVNLTQELSRRHTSRQIDILFDQGYLHLIKSHRYRNKNKFTKLYGLSIKGFIASLHEKNIQDNYFFKKYLSLFPDELKSPVKKFLSLSIAEFILYHKSIGLKIDNIYDMPKYIKEIIYDYDLITNKDDVKKFKKINDDFSVIDEIRDIITDMRSDEPNEPDEPNEYHISSSGLDTENSFIEGMITDGLNEDMRHDYNRDYYYPRESIKCEFLMNFWPYIIDEIGKETDLESHLDGVSEKSPPFGLTSYEENIQEFYKKKQFAIMTQWLKRKLNFEPTISWSFTPEELHSGNIFKKINTT